jgi:hypothetical protein
MMNQYFPVATGNQAPNRRTRGCRVAESARPTVTYALLGDVQQDADHEQQHHQAGAAEADERQRQALGGQAAGHHADVERGLQADQNAVMPKAIRRPAGIGRAAADAQPAKQKDHEQQHHARRGARNAQLLADDGENEVGVGLGQVMLLLHALAQALAPAPPATKA